MTTPGGTRIRIVDYVANLGGGARFVQEMLKAIVARGPAGLQLEVISSGPGLERYRGLLSAQPQVRFRDVAPSNRPRRSFKGFKGANLLNSVTGLVPLHHEIPPAAFEDCDLVWLPWIHGHRALAGLEGKVVGSFHDTISLEFPGILSEAGRRDETEGLRRWLASPARIAASSNATRANLQRLFGISADRVALIPLSGVHRAAAAPVAYRRWPFSGLHYLFCPANTTLHKNHEVLLEGVGQWGGRYPLVLTGDGADLSASQARGSKLLGIARRAGLVPGSSLIPLGYVDDSSYHALLAGAWAMVMPTLAEGGGSFPVLEALHAGLPVISADIPVMREMVERFGGEPLWFDPRRPAELAARLRELEADYSRYRAAAAEQATRMKSRTWDDVARDYAELMGLGEQRRATFPA